MPAAPRAGLMDRLDHAPPAIRVKPQLFVLLSLFDRNR
jgi:hypothetical protein